MKLLSFTILTFISVSSSAVEFHRCVNDKGHTHFTNLSKESLDSNCVATDRHTLMLNQDYSNLANEHEKYKVTAIELDDLSVSDEFQSENIEQEEIDLSVDSLTQSVKDVFDPDKAFVELMEATEKRDDAFTKAMRGRSKGIERISN